MEYSPRHLLKMEENSYDENVFVHPDEDYMGSDTNFAKVMAITIPTLETMSPGPLSFFDNRWIERAPDGSIVTVKADAGVPKRIRDGLLNIVPHTAWCGGGDIWKFSLAELKERGQ